MIGAIGAAAAHGGSAAGRLCVARGAVHQALGGFYAGVGSVRSVHQGVSVHCGVLVLGAVFSIAGGAELISLSAPQGYPGCHLYRSVCHPVH